MRKIKFRAIGSVDTKWYYGQYVKCNSYKESVECIVDEENHFIEIDSESIGQFTGLLDKNGKEIYEGDIIEGKFDRYVWRYVVKPFEHGDNNMYLFTYYRNFTNDYDDNETFGDFYEIGDWTQLSVNSDKNTHEVIGNIYENPELLNG